MPIHELHQLASKLPQTWSSEKLGTVGSAAIKIVRMDEQPYQEEIHQHNEALLVMDGQMNLLLAGKEMIVKSGEMCLIEAGTPHAVSAGSRGTLMIIDVV